MTSGFAFFMSPKVVAYIYALIFFNPFVTYIAYVLLQFFKERFLAVSVF